MRRLLGLLLGGTALFLGLLTGIASVAVHQRGLGLLLAGAASVAAIRALRVWAPPSAAAFTAGWLVPVLVALAGRAEGDYAVASGGSGYLLIGLGIVILVTGLASGLTRLPRDDSGSEASPA